MRDNFTKKWAVNKDGDEKFHRPLKNFFRKTLDKRFLMYYNIDTNKKGSAFRMLLEKIINKLSTEGIVFSVEGKKIKIDMREGQNEYSLSDSEEVVDILREFFTEDEIFPLASGVDVPYVLEDEKRTVYVDIF